MTTALVFVELFDCRAVVSGCRITAPAKSASDISVALIILVMVHLHVVGAALRPPYRYNAREKPPREAVSHGDSGSARAYNTSKRARKVGVAIFFGPLNGDSS